MCGLMPPFLKGLMVVFLTNGAIKLMTAHIKYQLADVVDNVVSLTIVTEREDESVRSTQIISLPVVVGCVHHAKMF